MSERVRTQYEAVHELVRNGLKREQDLKEKLLRCKAALYDIQLHSKEPFTGDKWTTYVHETACEALKATE